MGQFLKRWKRIKLFWKVLSLFAAVMRVINNLTWSSYTYGNEPCPDYPVLPPGDKSKYCWLISCFLNLDEDPLDESKWFVVRHYAVMRLKNRSRAVFSERPQHTDICAEILTLQCDTTWAGVCVLHKDWHSYHAVVRFIQRVSLCEALQQSWKHQTSCCLNTNLVLNLYHFLYLAMCPVRATFKDISSQLYLFSGICVSFLWTRTLLNLHASFPIPWWVSITRTPGGERWLRAPYTEYPPLSTLNSLQSLLTHIWFLTTAPETLNWISSKLYRDCSPQIGISPIHYHFNGCSGDVFQSTQAFQRFTVFYGFPDVSVCVSWTCIVLRA